MNTEICMTAVCIVHFIAASNKKILEGRGTNGDHPVRSLVFFVKVVQKLPAYGTMLLRYIISVTLRDIHERHMPYERLRPFHRSYGLEFPDELEDDQRKARLFIRDCVNTHTFALLDGYVPLYNLLADSRLHQGFIRTITSKALGIIRFFPRPPMDRAGPRDATFTLGYFALHANLIEIMKEGEISCPFDRTVDIGWSVWRRLSVEYDRMQAMDKALGRMFAGMRFTPNEIRDLDLEGIGRSLKDITTELQTMSEEEVAELGLKHYEMYMLDRWGEN